MMRRKIWKRLFSIGVAAFLLTSAPGMTLLADEMQTQGNIESYIDESEDAEDILSDESVHEHNENEFDLEDDEFDSGMNFVEDDIESSGEALGKDSDEVDVGDIKELNDSGSWYTFNKETGKLLFCGNQSLDPAWREVLVVQGPIRSIGVAYGTVYLGGSNQELVFDDMIDLISFDSRGFNTSNMTGMDWLFSRCYSLTNVDLSGFDTSNVKYMNRVFEYCRSLTNLDLSSFNTSNVKSMDCMFLDCSSLKNVDLSGFDTSNVNYMSDMFSGCSSLTNLDLSSFNTSNVKSMDSMFLDCSSLTNLDLSGFNTSNVTVMIDMFGGCSSLKNVDLSGFDTSNVNYMSGMFRGCSSLRNLDLSSFIISCDEQPEHFFDGCSELSFIKTPRIIDYYCSIPLPFTMYDELGHEYSEIPPTIDHDGSIIAHSYILTKEKPILKNLSECTVTLSKTNYTYNGSAKKPAVTVKDGENVLILGTDYTVSYLNNKNAGKATVKVVGIGNRQGENSASFTIQKAVPELAFAWDGVLKTLLDTNFTNSLIKTSDGKVTYTSSNENVAAVDTDSGFVTIKGIGETIITATVAEGKNYKQGTASYTLTVAGISIEKATVAGVSLSYGYSGKPYTPAITVTLNGVTLTEGTDYTVKYENNVNPGTATVTITGKGNYTGTKIKTFEIVKCVSTFVAGNTYQLIPKNNSQTAVCSYSGKMVNNTKVYITDRSNSEAMKFKVVKNSDGTVKFINVKCELALAVQQNSSEVGKGLVLYDQTTKKAQNWKLSKKSDNSFAIINAVTGYSIAMSDASAVKGTTLSMAETESSGLQRFYIVETTPVSTPFDGTYGVRASKDSKFALNVASSSTEDGANVNLYSYSNTNAKKFKIMYSGSGYYRLVNVNSGLCLTVKGNTKTDGANVIQSKWAAQSGQRWNIVKNPDGTVMMTNALGTVLHLTGNKTADGTNIVAKNASASTAQKWYLQ